MTIDILFMAKNKLVLRVNMCFSNLHCKIFCELPIEDQKKWIFDFDADDRTFSEQRFVDFISGDPNKYFPVSFEGLVFLA